MNKELETARKQLNYAHYKPDQKAGHYESFFQRANHPSRPLAFWIRYTIFSPEKRPEDALGELWAIYFDGESGYHVAVKKEVPFRQCTFKRSEFFVEVADAQLESGKLKGGVTSGTQMIAWNLTFSGEAEPIFFLPLRLYKKRFPKAKSLVGLPMAIYNGSLSVDGKEIDITGWVGSQNHNWGTKHTDLYAWGQVAGFDSHPDSFLEVATARLKIGPFWTPFMTPMVLRHRGEEITFNTLKQMFWAKGSFNYFTWNFRSETDKISLEGAISAPREAFVGLNYYNPPGGNKHCLNSKIASCELKVTYKQSGKSNMQETLFTKHRAAFEILTDDQHHGVEIRV